MARMAMPMFEMGEYEGFVDSRLIQLAKANENLSGEYLPPDGISREHREKDYKATIEYLHREGCDTAAFFLQDEMKRFF